MVQTVPAVQIFQDFTLVPTAIVQPLRAYVFGPHYNVRSYAKAKSSIGLGSYVPAVDTPYSWPGRLAGEIVDQSFTQLFADSAWINYFNYAGNTSLISSVAPNILRLATDGWTAVTGYGRNTGIPRDVAIGDGVTVTNPADATSTLTAKVRGFVRTPIAAAIAAHGTVGPANAGTTSSSQTPVSSPGGSPFTPTLTLTAYKPYKAGITGDRYTFKITTAGLSGAARMSVTTDSGKDSQFNVVVTTGVLTVVGTLGMKITFADSGTSTYNLGDTWVIDAVCNFTVTAGSHLNTAGTYTGPTTTNYIVTIVTGGIVATDSPTFSVRTADGTDAGGPYAAQVTPLAIGNYGVTLGFTTATNLCAGDVFSFSVTTAGVGAVRDLILDQTIPSPLVLSDVVVAVSAIRNLVITGPRYGAPLVPNYTQTPTQITVKAGILSYTSEAGLSGYPVIAASLYASYRALSQTYATDIHTLSDPSLVSTFFGDVTPENPLGYGVFKALQNSAGTDVRFLGVPTNDLAGFSYAVNKTLEKRDVYSFAPLTKDTGILSMVQGSVDAQSTPEKGRWRISWVTEAVNTLLQIIGAAGTVVATITHDVADPSGIYKLITDSTATFLDSGVLAGDTFRYNYATDALGNPTYLTDTVDTIVSQTQLRILTGAAAPVVVAEKYQVWRTQTPSAQAADVVARQTYGDRRIYSVIGGNQNDADGFSNVDDIYLAAAYAGLRGGVAPHQGLTNVALTGFTNVNWTTRILTAPDRDVLMNGGLWVVQQDDIGGAVYCRKELSTDLTDLNTSEQMVTTNVDSISYYLLSILQPYIGRTNNVPRVQDLIQGDIQAAFDFFFNNSTSTLGAQILDGTQILSIRPHATLPDRLVIKIRLVVPYALNGIDVYLVV